MWNVSAARARRKLGKAQVAARANGLWLALQHAHRSGLSGASPPRAKRAGCRRRSSDGGGGSGSSDEGGGGGDGSDGSDRSEDGDGDRRYDYGSYGGAPQVGQRAAAAAAAAAAARQRSAFGEAARAHGRAVAWAAFAARLGAPPPRPFGLEQRRIRALPPLVPVADADACLEAAAAAAAPAAAADTPAATAVPAAVVPSSWPGPTSATGRLQPVRPSHCPRRRSGQAPRPFASPTWKLSSPPPPLLLLLLLLPLAPLRPPPLCRSPTCRPPRPRALRSPLPQPPPLLLLLLLLPLLPPRLPLLLLPRARLW